MMLRTPLLVGLLALGTVSAVGCDSGMVPVRGTVTLNGQPAAGLQVVFSPKDPTTATAAIGFTQTDGAYALHYPGEKIGVPAGQYVVRITTAETDGPRAQRLKIPAKYNTQSELTATVTPGQTQHDFQLTVP